MIKRYGWGLVVAVFASINCGASKAWINDVAVRGRVHVLGVDGKPPVRAQSKFFTMIPYVQVDPGQHTFRVRLEAVEGGAPEETLLVTATVVAGKRYRFEGRGEALRLVREPDQMR